MDSKLGLKNEKTLIALAVAGAAVATGANANELYNKDGDTLTMGGRAEARLSLKDGKADDLSRVRLNFLGKKHDHRQPIRCWFLRRSLLLQNQKVH